MRLLRFVAGCIIGVMGQQSYIKTLITAINITTIETEGGNPGQSWRCYSQHQVNIKLFTSPSLCQFSEYLSSLSFETSVKNAIPEPFVREGDFFSLESIQLNQNHFRDRSEHSQYTTPSIRFLINPFNQIPISLARSEFFFLHNARIHQSFRKF